MMRDRRRRRRLRAVWWGGGRELLGVQLPPPTNIGITRRNSTKKNKEKVDHLFLYNRPQQNNYPASKKKL